LNSQINEKFNFPTYKKMLAALKLTTHTSLYKEFKTINKMLRRVIGKADLNATQLDMTIVGEESEDPNIAEPFKLEELEELIKIDDARIDQDKYKLIISKFYATIRYKMYHKI